MKEKNFLSSYPQHKAGTDMVLGEQLAKESEGEGAEECLAQDGHRGGAVLGVSIPDQMGALVHP